MPFDTIGVNIYNKKTNSNLTKLPDLIENMCIAEESKSYYAITREGKTVMMESSVKNIILEKLYNLVRDKITKLDPSFQEIYKSNGDITKYKHYTTLDNTIKVINNICNEQKINLSFLNHVNELYNNLLKNKNLLEDAFRYDVSIVKHYYTMCVSSFIYILSYITSTMIDYERKMEHIDYKVIFNQINIRNNGIPENMQNLIIAFNNDIKSGSIKKSIENMKKVKPSTDSEADAVLITLAVVFSVIATLVIAVPLIRYTISFFLNLKLKIIDFIEEQEAFLALNIKRLKAQNADKTIVEKQEVWLEKLKSFAAKLSGEKYIAEKKTEKEISDENKVVVKEADSEAKSSGETSTPKDLDILL